MKEGPSWMGGLSAVIMLIRIPSRIGQKPSNSNLGSETDA
jgi:hypothetical protein